MRIRYSFLLCLIPIVVFSQPVWQPTNGPYGGQVNALLTKPSTGRLFAACYPNGVFGSTDKGSSWTEMKQGLSSPGTWSLVQNSAGDIFVGTYGGVFISTNNGASWSQTALTNGGVFSMAIDQNDRLYAFGAQGLYRTTNSGADWVKVSTETMSSAYINAVAVNSAGDVFIAVGSNGLFRSTDQGNSWTQINTSYVTGVAVRQSTGELFACSYTIYHSTDNGSSWNEIPFSLGNIQSIFIYDMTGSIFLGLQLSGIYASTNQGATWTQIGSCFNGVNVRDLTIDGTSTLYAATAGMGVYSTSNGGATWRQSNQGVQNSIILSMTVSGSGNIFAGASLGGTFSSTNHGTTWTQQPDTLIGTDVTALVYKRSGNTLFAGTLQGIFRSNDDGASWHQKNSGMLFPSIYSLAVNSGGTIFCCSFGDGVYSSSDDGENWQVIKSGLTTTNVTGICIQPTTGALFLATQDQGLWRSTNSGGNWSQSGSGITAPEILAVAADAYSGGILFASTYDGTYRSTNNGASWIGVTPAVMKSFVSHRNGQMFLGALNQVYRSLDSGKTWAAFGNSISNVWIEALAIDSNGYLYAGTSDKGVYRTANVVPVRLMSFSAKHCNGGVRLDWTTASERNNYGFMIERKTDPGSAAWVQLRFIASKAPNSSGDSYSFIDKDVHPGSYVYRLKQLDLDGSMSYSPEVAISIDAATATLSVNCRPNPAYGQMTLHYFVPEDNFITIRIYNSLGREVSVPVAGLEIAGSHSVLLNTAAFEAGLYSCTLTSGMERVTSMVLFVK